MSVHSLACTRKFSRLGNASHLMRWTTLARLAWLAIGLFLPMRGFAGELHFTVVQVESLQPFQPYEGFQLATLAQTPEVNIRVNRLTDRITRHTHPNSHHFLYFIKGQVELSLGAETRVVSGGDFVTIPRGIPHAMHRIGESEAVFLDVASPPDVGDVIWHE
jgi:mannose-6-phosphate isomerase-like protein (cupin superfamily)